ncbi:MAG TPA: Fis family transcriptional regulator [Actinomycetota bacterium]|nr:Fis family transcriptional regulator [Actinomycetota bacterium]
MSGPTRKARARCREDPERYRPCVRCGGCLPPYGRWPEGVVCQHCAARAKRTSGVCAGCSHQGVLPGFDADGRPICRTCSGISLPVDCLRCATEAWLYRAGTCWRCALADQVDALLAGPDGNPPMALVPLADALKGMASANSGITWLRSARVQEMLRQLASGEVALTHAAIDALPASRTVEHMRELLVAHGALPGRDRYLAAFQRWCAPKLASVADPEHRRAVEAFVRWHVLPHLRNHAADTAVGTNSFLRAKQSVTTAIELLEWLSQRGRSLAEWTQGDVDAWFAGGTSTRKLSHPFAYWAIRTRRAGRVDVPRAEPRSHPKVSESERLSSLRRLLLNDALHLHWRVAGALVLLFGQPAVRISGLRLEQLSVLDGGRVRIRIAADWLEVPEPLAVLVCTHLAARPNMQTATNATSPWVFPGVLAGRHIDPGTLVTQLRSIGVPVMATKTGTWHQLVREGPPTLLAQALGISPVTAMKHAQAAGADWLRYASLAR